MLSLIVLAAGESSRMRFPKALLRIGEETFLECILRKANAAGINTAIVVTGPDHDAISRPVQSEVRFVRNENYMQGQISSLQKGILALPTSVSAVMIWPVDQPLVRIETVGALIASYESERKALTIPVYQHRKGHPVIYSRAAMTTAVHFQPHQTGKDLQATYSADRALIDVEDAGVVIDIDTPEDYEKYVGGQGRSPNPLV